MFKLFGRSIHVFFCCCCRFYVLYHRGAFLTLFVNSLFELVPSFVSAEIISLRGLSCRALIGALYGVGVATGGFVVCGGFEIQNNDLEKS